MAKSLWGKITFCILYFNIDVVTFCQWSTDCSGYVVLFCFKFSGFALGFFFVGSYTAEPINDFSWVLVSMGVQYIMYFIPVQFIAYVSIRKYITILLKSYFVKIYFICKNKYIHTISK